MSPQKSDPRPAAEGGAVTLAGEDWTAAEVEEVRDSLQAEISRLGEELQQAQDHLEQLREGQSAASGEDPIDSGTHAQEREGELSIVAHAEQTIRQCEEALTRLDAGTYGVCENCGGPVGKRRLQAFPKALTCIDCQKRQERR